jgi:hypothetical protein
MILKIQKPLFTTDNVQTYLIYNKSKSLVIDDIEIGQSTGLDKMFEDEEVKIYIEGYIDKKDRLIVKRKVEQQDW